MEEKLQQILHENKDLFSKLAATKKRANTIIFPLVALSAIVTGIYSLLHKDEEEYIIIAVAIAVFIIGILLIVRYRIINEQNSKYKQNVIPAILSIIGTSFKYNINTGHTKQEFFDSTLYNSNITDYESDNMISGMMGDTAVKISHIDAKRIEGSEKPKGRSSHEASEHFSCLCRSQGSLVHARSCSPASFLSGRLPICLQTTSLIGAGKRFDFQTYVTPGRQGSALRGEETG